MMSKNQNIPKRGEIWLAEFPLIKESRKPTRPCLVISNDLQNEYGKWIVVIALTTKDIKSVEPFEVLVEKTKQIRIDKPSKLKLNYPQTIDKERLKEYLGVVDRKIIEEAKKAWKISFDMENW